MAVSSPATDTTDAAEPAHRTAIDARVKVRSGWHGMLPGDGKLRAASR